MASTPTRLMSFAEFEKFPDPKEGRYELHHGELVHVPPPKPDHFLIQQMLKDLLDQAAAGRGRAYTEAGFRILPEGEYRVFDVAYSSKKQWIKPKDGRYFSGAPELAIEVLSPRNTAAKISQTRDLSLSNGCREFWVINPKHQSVDVSTPDGRTVTYKSGDEIPLMFGGAIAVDAVFAEA
jgi:Uma2 family endonuclease